MPPAGAKRRRAFWVGARPSGRSRGMHEPPDQDTGAPDPHAERGCALVTGASRGIGAAIAETLADAGWTVVVNYAADRDGAEQVVAAIAARGGHALALQADVADAAAVDRMFARAEEQVGPPLVLVNNAGVRCDRLVGGLQHEDWARVLDVNLTGTFTTLRRALGAMVRARFGRVVNISTVSASQPLPGQAAYAASKAGVEALTRTAAIEVARRGVTVNAVAPGLVATGFLPDGAQAWAAGLPARRLALPSEIAAAVRYLVSPAAAYVSGAVLRIDGGLTAGIPIVRPARSGTQQATTTQ
jgi:3-oxoacyl-[acyl-carrier protein] reductase